MKRIFSLLLILILVFSLCSLSACKKNVESGNVSSKVETETLKPDNENTPTTSTDNFSSGNSSENSQIKDESASTNENTSSDNTSSTVKPTKPQTTPSGTTSTDKNNSTTEPNTETKPTVPDTKPSTPTDDKDTTNTSKPSNDGANNNNNTGTTKPNEKPTTPEETPQKPEVVSPSSQMISVIKNEFLKLVNDERSKYGFQKLSSNEVLNQAADVRAKECFDVFSHTRPNGSSYSSLFDDGEFEYDYCSLAENLTITTNFGDKYVTEENIFTGTDEQLKEVAKILFNNFKNSQSHLTTMLSNDFEDIGIGISTSADKKTNILYISCCNLFGVQ